MTTARALPDRRRFIRAFGPDPMRLPDIEVVSTQPGDTERVLAAVGFPPTSATVEWKADSGPGSVASVVLKDGLVITCWDRPLRMDFDLVELQSDDSDARFDALLVFLQQVADVVGRTVQVLPEGCHEPVLVIAPSRRTAV